MKQPAYSSVAAVVWSMNGPEYFSLVRERGHSPEEFAALVSDVWRRALLTER